MGSNGFGNFGNFPNPEPDLSYGSPKYLNPNPEPWFGPEGFGFAPSSEPNFPNTIHDEWSSLWYRWRYLLLVPACFRCHDKDICFIAHARMCRARGRAS